MKLRLARGTGPGARPVRPRSRDALQHLEEASIGTIHSFCAQILRERPVEARVDPAFEELNEQESGRLYQRAFRAWLERRLGADSPGLRRAFARLAWRDSWDDSPPLEQLQWAGRKLVEWRDYTAPWRREPFARDEEIDTIVRMVRELAALVVAPAPRHRQSVQRHWRRRALWPTGSSAPNNAGRRDYDALESLLLKLGARSAPRSEEGVRRLRRRRRARGLARAARRAAALDRRVPPARRRRSRRAAARRNGRIWWMNTSVASTAPESSISSIC